MTPRFRALVASLVVIGAFALCAPPRASEGATEALSWQEAQAVICFDGAAWDCGEALYHAWRESRFTPDAYNPGCRCVGLFQIAGIHGYRVDQLTDPYFNVAVAHDLYLQSGWAPWR